MGDSGGKQEQQRAKWRLERSCGVLLSTGQEVARAVTEERGPLRMECNQADQLVRSMVTYNQVDCFILMIILTPTVTSYQSSSIRHCFCIITFLHNCRKTFYPNTKKKPLLQVTWRDWRIRHCDDKEYCLICKAVLMIDKKYCKIWKHIDANIKEQCFVKSGTWCLVCRAFLQDERIAFIPTNSLQITFLISLSCWQRLAICVPTNICWLVRCVSTCICLWDVLPHTSVCEIYSYTHLLAVCISYAHLLVICVPAVICWHHICWCDAFPYAFNGNMFPYTHQLARCVSALISVGKMHSCMHICWLKEYMITS